ncbi:hypothetical protein SLE2022_319380 [Rubroshorea leprosula]
MHEESYLPMFFQCPWGKEVWSKVAADFSFASIRCEHFIDDFLDLFLALKHEEQELLAVALWSIWNNRNQCVFNHLCLSPDKATRMIKVGLTEFKEATESEQRKAKGSLQQLTNKSTWQLPPTGIIKINNDAVIPNGGGIAGLGVVIRNSNGDVRGSGQRAVLFNGTALHGEILALNFGPQLGKEFGYRNGVIDSDYLQAINFGQIP